MIKIKEDYPRDDIKLKESTNNDLIRRAEKYLNYHLGEGEEYVAVDNAEVVGKTDLGKDIVKVEYSVRMHIPIWTDPETGTIEYEDDYEYRIDNIVI